jgi:hypothetical protein
MGNQNTSGIEKIVDPGLSKIDQQIPFNVETNSGWPEPTKSKKSDAAEVGPAQGRYGLGWNAFCPCF